MNVQMKRRVMRIVHDVFVHPIIGVFKAFSPSTKPRDWLHEKTLPPMARSDSEEEALVEQTPDNVVSLFETVYVCPDCGHQIFQIIGTYDSGGPVCRCVECGWCEYKHGGKAIEGGV